MSDMYDAIEMVEELQDRGIRFPTAVWQAADRLGIEPQEILDHIGAQSRSRLLQKHKRYLQSPEWAITRERHLTAHPACDICCTTWQLQVHHLNYKNIPHERDEDLQTLCKRCHEEEHGRTFEPESDEARLRRMFNPPENAAIAANIRKLTALHRARAGE